MDELMRRRAQMLAAKKEYIIFADPEVERICIQRYSSDGIGVTMQDAARATTLSTYFRDNTVMVSFDELEYFTRITSLYGSGTGSNAYGALSTCTSLVSVVLPVSITQIAQGAFKNSTALASVTGGGTINRVEQYSFYNCSSLTTIPSLSNVTYLGRQAFRGCTALEIEVNMPSLTTIDDTAHFRQSGIKKVISLGTITRIYNNSAANGGMFYGCKKLTDVTIPSTVTAIDRSSFDGGCTALTTVNFNSAHCSVGQNAFYSCTGLTTVINSDNITSIALGGFVNCTSLTSISLRSCVSIGGGTGSNQGAFRGCTSLTSVTFGNSLTSLAACVFQGCSNLVTADLPTSLTSIGQYAFYLCTKLTGELNLPNLTSIGDYSFRQTKITKITSLGSVTSLPGGTGSTQGMFRQCTALTDVVLPNTLTTIGPQTFYLCSNLVTCNIPQSVTGIGLYAFYQCSKLTGILNLPNLTILGDYSFRQTKITRIESLGSITSVPGGTGTTQGVFRDCSALTYADIPSTVTSIGGQAFRACSSLTTLIVRATTPPTLGSNALYGNPSSQIIYVPAGCGATYQAASGWSSYSSRIHELDEDGNIPT